MTTTAPGRTEVAPAVGLPGRTRLGAVIALAGVGLVLQGAADALARNGDGTTALRLFVAGMAVLVGACAWRLTSASARRNERLLVSLVLGLGLLASYLMRYPLFPSGFDELQQRATLSHLLSSHALFPTNALLPVSPYYPGLELATAATRWLTGLPVVIDQVLVLTVIRVLLVLAVFLLVERSCGSARAGGVGALVYMSNPAFYGFDSQYAYETMALALAAAAVYLLFASIDRPRPGTGRLFALALCTVAALVVTHHLTSWLTVGFLVVWAVGLALSARMRRAGSPVQRTRWSSQARIVAGAAAASVALVAGWTLLVGSRIAGYLGPIFSAAYSDIVSAVGSLHGNRTLFDSASGSVTPTWDKLLILGAAAAWCLILVPSLYRVVFTRSLRGGPLRYLPAVIAATYPILLLANVSSNAKVVAGRAIEFTFFGVALVVGAWVARRIERRPRWPERIATVAVAVLCAVGSLLFGIGPVSSVLPGKYQVGADELSLGSPSLAVAHWAAMNIPAGTHIAADRDNGDLLNAISGLEPVTVTHRIDPTLLYFDRTLTPYDISVIRRADIHYVVVDDRLAQSLPLYGMYIASGEPTSRLTLEELNKFSSSPGIRRVYDNGPIKVYDVSALLTRSQRAAPSDPPAGPVGSSVEVGILLLALLVAGLWTVRLVRRRPRQESDAALIVVCALATALVCAVFGAFVVRAIRVPPEAAAVVVLVVAGALCFWRRPGRVQADDPSSRDEPVLAAPGHRPTTQVLLGIGGAALVVTGFWVAAVASLSVWTPPPELAFAGASAEHGVAQVQLGSAGPAPAQLWVAHRGRVVRITDLAPTTSAQTVRLPAVAAAAGSRVALVVRGRSLRSIGN